MVRFKMYLERRIQEMKLPNMIPRFGANLMVDSVAINLDRQEWGRKEIMNRVLEEPVKFEMVIKHPGLKLRGEVNTGGI